MDAFSPSAPARVRTLVLPVGRIKRSRFYSFLDLLVPNCEIKLGDVTPDPRPDRAIFSPAAFPDGYVLYDFMTSAPSDVQLSLSPFELFREPLLVLGIADSTEYEDIPSLQELVESALERMEEDYSRILVHKVLLFDFDVKNGTSPLLSGAITVPSPEQLKATSMHTIMCDITSLLLAEMTTLAASLKALPSMASPSIASSGAGNAPWRSTGSPILSRTNSQTGERPESPNPNSLHRMSMPVFPSNSDFSGSRPGSPNDGSQTPPARTFDEMVGSGTSITGSQRQTPTNSRDTSRDRVSISGFGPGSLDERKRNQGKCRVTIVISSLYILAGRWDDALRDLTDAAALARSFSDHIWHAKALENMMTCLILMAWAGVPFKIPPICYPILERTSSKLAQITSPTSPTPNGSPSADQSTAKRQLADLIPDLSNMILGTYNRAANYTGEYLPQIAFSDCVIRLSKTQAGVYIGYGTLNSAAFSYIVRGMMPQENRRHAGISGKTRITEMVMRAMPGPPEASGLSAADEATTLAGIASVLSTLGLHRKKAMLLKEYLQVLIRALDEAKRSDAAEAGIHPSTNGFAHASLMAPGSCDASEGLEDFLNLLCQVYGIPESRWSRSVGSETLHGESPTDREESAENIPDQLVGNFILRSFGSVGLKADVLKVCIKLCEALPDPHGVLHWTSALLRTAGPGTAPSADSTDVLVNLSREEQLVLSSTISKTVTDAKAMGLQNIDAEYWDEFLVRGIILIEASPALALHSHKKSDLLATEPKQIAKKGPFIHNPFLEKPKAAAVQNMLVAGDEREFMVSLQNPYDFEIYIESIGFMAGDRKFGYAKQLVLRPYRTQSFSVLGIVSVVGAHELDKCIIKIQGCRERAFSIFAQAWKPEYDPKVKSIGQLKTHSKDTRPESNMSTVSTSSALKSFPKATTIPLTILPPQATLEITSVSLPQSSLMLLEGESTIFQVIVKNTSKSVIADFFHVSFTDSTTAAIQDALSKKNLGSVELFELEYQLAHHPAIKLVGEKPSTIQPEETHELSFEILGKPGLTNVTILIDYANLQTPHTDNQNIFYTRQLTLPLAVTVNASVQLNRLDVLPVSGDIATGGLISKVDSQVESCLLLLDLRNAWPVPLEITVEKLDGTSYDPSRPTKAFLKTQEVVQPGHIVRMILLLPKIYVKDPHKRIRSANERQFVVSSNTITADAERMIRELFWYREALLGKLNATWKQEGGTKHGIIDLRSAVRLTPRIIDILKLDDVEIRMSISGSGVCKAQATRSGFEVNVDECVALTTKITNRSDATIYPILRLRPSLSHQPSDIALDLGKRLAWSGLLQTILPPIATGETVESNLAICALCTGEYEFGATVEEAKRPRTINKEAESVDAIPDPVSEMAGRRSWIAPRPCRIVAVD